MSFRDPALDALWLGIRSSEENELGSSAVVHVSVTGVDGPGDVVGYLTGSFGQAEVFLDSRVGFSAADGYRDDTFTLPVAGHSHMSWAFPSTSGAALASGRRSIWMTASPWRAI